jgi:hypothetical protein
MVAVGEEAEEVVGAQLTRLMSATVATAATAPNLVVFSSVNGWCVLAPQCPSGPDGGSAGPPRREVPATMMAPRARRDRRQ